MEIAGIEELRALAADAASARGFSPLSARQYLLFDVGGVDDARVGAWLRGLACPTISLGGGALARTADVALERTEDPAALLATIARAPIAAAVLVQLLRATKRMPLESALVAESLAYSTLQAGPEFRAWLAAHPLRASTDAKTADDSAVLMTRDGALLRLKLNRPDNRNAMSVEMRDALMEALQLALADDSIEKVEISARGKCFSVGGDLSEFGSAPDPATAHIVRSLALPGRLLAALGARARVHVHGACIGSGAEFPAFAAHISANTDAWFQLPELEFGLIPGAGDTVSIARRIGRQRTAWMALSGKRINAQRALDWKLVDALA